MFRAKVILRTGSLSCDGLAGVGYSASAAEGVGVVELAGAASPFT